MMEWSIPVTPQVLSKWTLHAFHSFSFLAITRSLWYAHLILPRPSLPRFCRGPSFVSRRTGMLSEYGRLLPIRPVSIRLLNRKWKKLLENILVFNFTSNGFWGTFATCIHCLALKARRLRPGLSRPNEYASVFQKLLPCSNAVALWIMINWGINATTSHVVRPTRAKQTKTYTCLDKPPLSAYSLHRVTVQPRKINHWSQLFVRIPCPYRQTDRHFQFILFR